MVAHHGKQHGELEAITLFHGEVSVGEVGDDPAPPPAALLAGEVDMAARAGAGSLPAPLPMQRYGKISCCVMPL